MCIFNFSVQNVSNTRIFAAPTTDGRQLTIYQNKVKSIIDNAMILPVPYYHTGSEIELLDLSSDNGIFEKLHKAFEMPSKSGVPKGKGPSKAAVLKVHKVGNYDISIVETIDQFSLLDTSVFTIADGVFAALSEQYPSQFAFLVCKFTKTGIADMHPIGWVHQHHEGESEPKALFIPTVHIHDGEIHPKEHFDHDIYVMGVDQGRHAFKMLYWNVLQQSSFYDRLAVDGYELRLIHLEGEHENEDLYLDIYPPGTLDSKPDWAKPKIKTKPSSFKGKVGKPQARATITVEPKNVSLVASAIWKSMMDNDMLSNWAPGDDVLELLEREIVANFGTLLDQDS